MKSMSIAPQGSSTLACVCRCSSGLRSASRPLIHILAGENVCIHVTTPPQRSSAVASSVAAIDREWATTWLTTASPYRPWLPVRNHTSAGADGLVMGNSFGGSLAVDVLVAVVEA